MSTLTTAYTIAQLLELWNAFNRAADDFQSTDSRDYKMYVIGAKFEGIVFAVNVRRLGALSHFRVLTGSVGHLRRRDHPLVCFIGLSS